MSSLYQLVFFLGVSLLAIVIAVFVLAVSLLGRAINQSAKEQIQAEESRKTDTENEMAKIQSSLVKSRTENRSNVQDLTKILGDLQKKENRHKWKIRWIRMKPKLLTATWGAMIPGSFFLLSSILSIFAVYWDTNKNAVTAETYLVFAIISLVTGITLLCLTLKAIESVAKTSDETSLRREAELIKNSLIEIENEKKPELELVFNDSLPFEENIDAKLNRQFQIRLVKGTVARNIQVIFYAPPGFTFSNIPKGPVPPPKYENYSSAKIEISEMMYPLSKISQLRMSLPSISGEFTLAYSIICEDYFSGHQEFKVIITDIEPDDIPF